MAGRPIPPPPSGSPVPVPLWRCLHVYNAVQPAGAGVRGARVARGSGSAAGVALAAAALAAAGCERGASAGAPERLVLADLRQPATSLTFVAESAGCFR